MLKSGRLRHRVNFERQVRQQDKVTGDIRLVWSSIFASVPAAIEPMTAKDFQAANSTQSEATTRIVVRYREGLSPTQRIVHMKRGKRIVYNPTRPIVDRDSGLEFVTIYCTEGVNDGA